MDREIGAAGMADLSAPWLRASRFPEAMARYGLDGFDARRFAMLMIMPYVVDKRLSRMQRAALLQPVVASW